MRVLYSKIQLMYYDTVQHNTYTFSTAQTVIRVIHGSYARNCHEFNMSLNVEKNFSLFTVSPCFDI